MNTKRILILGLLGVNAILLAGLLTRMRWQSSTAQAQVSRGGHYLMASASDQTQSIVYVYNQDTGIITAKVTPNNNTNGAIWMAPYSISSDIKRARMRMH